jgi:hypothetical protein
MVQNWKLDIYFKPHFFLVKPLRFSDFATFICTNNLYRNYSAYLTIFLIHTVNITSNSLLLGIVLCLPLSHRVHCQTCPCTISISFNEVRTSLSVLETFTDKANQLRCFLLNCRTAFQSLRMLKDTHRPAQCGLDIANRSDLPTSNGFGNSCFQREKYIF